MNTRMIGQSVRAATIAMAWLWAGGGLLQAQTNPPTIIKQVTDGKPWTLMMVKENRTMKLTLNPDGTGKMEGGPVTLCPTWHEAASGGVCMKPMAMMSEKCVTFRREGPFMVGVNNGEVEFRLQR